MRNWPGALLLLLLISCESDEIPEPIRVIPNQMQPFVDQFIWEAEKRGMVLDVSKLSFEYESGIDGGTPNTSIAGICHRSDKLHLVKIDTLNSLWLLSGDLGHEEIIFHELGHCLLDRPHKDEKFLSGDFASIMRTVGLLQYGDLDNFSSLFVVPSGLRAHKRDYYIDELFNENTSDPCWSNPDIFSPYPLTFYNETFIEERQYRRMWIDPDDNLWFFGGEKNYQMVGGVFQEQLPGLEITAMSKDSQDNIWIAGFQHGELLIGTYVSKSFEPKFDSSDFPVVFSGIDQFLIDGSNRLWLGDEFGNLHVQFENGFDLVKGLPDGRVWTMRNGPDNSVYALKGGQFFIFESPQEFVHVGKHNSDLPSDFFRTLEIDASGVAWMLESGSGSYLVQFRTNFEVKRLELHQINLAEIKINSLTTGPGGDLWVATSNGIKKWEGEEFSRYCTYNTGVPILSFSRMAVGKNGNIWSIGKDTASSQPVLMLTEAGV